MTCLFARFLFEEKFTFAYKLWAFLNSRVSLSFIECFFFFQFMLIGLGSAGGKIRNLHMQNSSDMQKAFSILKIVVLK